MSIVTSFFIVLVVQVMMSSLDVLWLSWCMILGCVVFLLSVSGMFVACSALMSVSSV